jgi:uncharacterized protein
MDEKDRRADSAEGAPGKAPEAAEQGREAGKLDFGDAIHLRHAGGGIDGNVEASIAPDGMSAIATFFPPRGEGLPIDRAYVRELLLRLGVTFGVLDEAIDEAVMRCNLDRHLLRDVVVARGTPPVAEIPEHAALVPRFRRSGPLVADEVMQVDFRELSAYFIVHKDEVIATIIPRSQGTPGSDVRGKETPYPRESPETWSAGRDVERRGDTLAAVVDGRLAISAGKLDVDEVMLIKGGVDFHTGHIVFPGDVVIEGVVHDGFKVWSGGTIVCKATMDAFDVNAKKDLLCAQGIIGRKRGQVRVGGELKAKYIQNCKVACRGNVHVASALVNTRLYTLGTLDMGDKGVIMGGETYATHGIRCARLGNQAFQRTNIHAGTDFTVQQRLDQANERMRLLSARSRQVEAAAAAHPSPEADRARAEMTKIGDKLRIEISELLGKLDADDGAVVEVKGDIFPGVVIEICRVSIVVEEPLKACKFRLDKAAGRIIVER